MHTMHGMNTSNRFCNKQEALSTPLQVGIRKLPERPGRFGVLDIVQDQWNDRHKESDFLEQEKVLKVKDKEKFQKAMQICSL